jgi:hypothetical protein
MKLDLQQDYPGGIDRLWAVFSQPDYAERKYRSLGAKDVRMLHFVATPELIEVELERTAPVAPDKVPLWLRKLIGNEQAMHHHTVWRRLSPTRVAAELRITPVGRPVSARGTASAFELSPNRTRMVLSFDVESSVPLVGGNLAHLFAERIREALAADHAFTLRYIREHAERAQ